MKILGKYLDLNKYKVFFFGSRVAGRGLEEYYNVRCASPQMCFRELFNQGIIDYDETWIKMAEWRNAAVHAYKEALAEKIYSNLPRVLEYFQLLEKK